MPLAFLNYWSELSHRKPRLIETVCLSVLVLFSLYALSVIAKVPFTIHYASTDYYAVANNYLSANPPVYDDNTARLRTLGYPLFLYFVSFGSLSLPLIAIFQLSFGFLAPLVTYFALRRASVSAPATLILVLPVVITLVLQISSRTILNEHLYALSLFGLFVASAMLMVMRKKYLIGLILVFWVIACLTRSTALPLLIAITFLYPFDRWSQRFKWTGVACVLVALLAVFQSALTKAVIPGSTSGMGIFSMMNPIVVSREKDDWAIKRSDGPATARMIDIVSEFEASERGQKNIERQRNKMKVSQDFFENTLCKKDPGTVPSCFLETPTLESYWQIKWAAIRELGMVEADKLMLDVFFEQMLEKPSMYLTFWLRNTAYFLVGGNRDYAYKPAPRASLVHRNNFLMAYNKRMEDRFKKSFQPDLDDVLSQMNQGTKARNATKINHYVSPLWRGLFYLNPLVMGFGLILTIRYLFWRKAVNIYAAFLILGFVFTFYHGAAISALHPPLGRYVFPSLPMLLFGLSAIVIMSWHQIGGILGVLKKTSA